MGASGRQAGGEGANGGWAGGLANKWRTGGGQADELRMGAVSDSKLVLGMWESTLCSPWASPRFPLSPSKKVLDTPLPGHIHPHQESG